MPVGSAFCRVLTTACAVPVPSAATRSHRRSSCPWNPQPLNVSFVGVSTIREREVGSQPDGRIYRRSFEHIISRRTISVLPMGTVHNARNSMVASRKYISTIHDVRSNRRSVLHSNAIHHSEPRNVQASCLPRLSPALPWMRRSRFDGRNASRVYSLAQLPRPTHPRPVTRNRRPSCPLTTFLHLRRHTACTQMSGVRHSPGQLRSPHNAGLFQWRVTGSPLLYHTDCLFAGITDLASTLSAIAHSSASDRLHPAKVIRYFDRTPRATW